MEKFDSVDQAKRTLAEWRFNLEEFGALYPTVAGIYEVVTWCVGSLDTIRQCACIRIPGEI